MTHARRILFALTATLLCGLSLTTPRSASAHGLWGHIHVTGWAAENLPPGDLRDFLLDDPAVFNALIYGAAYTDSGYFVKFGPYQDQARAYGEHAHWEEFIQDFVEHIVDTYPPPWDNVEERKAIAFMMGVASHGIQDEIFDSLFLYQVQENDNGNQENADPASDGFLVRDGNARFIPQRFLPMDDLLEVYQSLEADITEDVILAGVGAMEGYVNDGLGLLFAETFADTDELPWTEAHYLDPAVPGSLRAEILPTAGYLQTLWKRVHGEMTEEDVIVFQYPEAPRRLRSGDSDSVDSWITFVTGIGVDSQTGSGTIEDAEGTEVPTNFTFTRWGSRYSRIIRFQPQDDLDPGEYVTAILNPGMGLIDGSTLKESHGHQVQVACDNAELCPPIEEPRVAAIDGSYGSTPEEPPVEEPPIEEPEQPEDNNSNVDAMVGGGSGNCSSTHLQTPLSLPLGVLCMLGGLIVTRRHKRA